MLKDGNITESNSFQKQKEMRFAVDNRGLNARTQAINLPIPDLQDALDSVGTAQSKIFSVMDLKSYFWQLPLHPDTADRSTFITLDGTIDSLESHTVLPMDQWPFKCSSQKFSEASISSLHLFSLIFCAIVLCLSNFRSLFCYLSMP